ncbi:MAG: glycosyltransferase family 4 protein [Flavisolibacter sp.]|nr:glycosyltransferase family 4 protein [Flavisolibacter sp.]
MQEEYEMYFIYRYSKNYETKLRMVLGSSCQIIMQPLYLTRFSDVFYNSNYPEIIKKIFFNIDRIFDFFLIYFIVWVPFCVGKIKKLRPHVVHINNGGYPGASSCLAFALAAKHSNVPKIIMHVNNLAYKRKWYDLPHYFLDRCLQKDINFFITGSEAARMQLHEKRGFDFDKIVNINNTVLQDKFSATTESLIQKPERELWIGFVGLLTERKGVSSLIEAAVILKSELQKRSAKVIIVGDGEQEEELKRLVKEKHLNDLVIFTGFTAEVYKYLCQFDMFVLPSISNEDFPYVLLEAMLSQKPVVSTKLAGIPEIVSNGETGYIITPGNVLELSEKIEILISDSDLRLRMGKKGYERYHSLFSYEETMDKLKKLYSCPTLV